MGCYLLALNGGIWIMNGAVDVTVAFEKELIWRMVLFRLPQSTTDSDYHLSYVPFPCSFISILRLFIIFFMIYNFFSMFYVVIRIWWYFHSLRNLNKTFSMFKTMAKLKKQDCVIDLVNWLFDTIIRHMSNCLNKEIHHPRQKEYYGKLKSRALRYPTCKNANKRHWI